VVGAEGEREGSEIVEPLVKAAGDGV